MKINRKYSIYFAALGAAALIFCVDALRKPGASDSSAADDVAVVASGASPAKPGASVSLASRLIASKKPGGFSIESMVDCFSVSRDFGGTPRNLGNGGFARTHTLSAVVKSATGGSAIVNQKVVKIGGMIDGYRLVALDGESATFASGSSRVVLSMPLPADNFTMIEKEKP